MELKRIEVLSAAKVAFALYAIMGLIVGGIMSIAALAGAALTAQEGNEEAALGLVFGIGAVIIMPIFYGVMGGLVGALMSALYNVIARVMGGLRVELS